MANNPTPAAKPAKYITISKKLKAKTSVQLAIKKSVPADMLFFNGSFSTTTFIVIKIFRQEKPDIVHSHTPKAGLLGMLAAKLCGIKVRIHTVAGMPLMVEKGFTLQAIQNMYQKCQISKKSTLLFFLLVFLII